ncbi:hypothetical protein [uncultured Bradyrhizobium sp.]|uniref:hypothetical protein n=1 Tax=uncultured Bradyrhizobium sp. TaxID=199684 RepID=UPI00345B7BFC
MFERQGFARTTVPEIACRTGSGACTGSGRGACGSTGREEAAGTEGGARSRSTGSAGASAGVGGRSRGCG